MVSLWVAVKARLVIFQDRLIGDAQPEAMTAVIRLVMAIRVARGLRLETVVVGIGSVVAVKQIAAADPAVQGANEHAIATVGDVVVQEFVVVRPGLYQ